MGAIANESNGAGTREPAATTRSSTADGVASDGASSDTGRTETDYALGVLVVHGIGDQKQGATLTTWVDALSEWCNTRDSKTVDPDERRLKAQVRRAMLRPSEGPAHVELNVTSRRTRTNARTQRIHRTTNTQSWLVAEGWWASTFEPPTFGELWSWSFISVPATAAMHANTMVAGAIRRWKSSRGLQAVYEGIRLAVMVLFLVALVMLSPLILVLLTVLLVLGLIAAALPIDALRNLVAKAQLISVGTIGDTKRLIDSPTQAGAIKSPVADGIAWLRERGCEKIVVLAHSQGAAVTYKTLVDMSEGLHGKVEPIDAFISVGSGIPKVHALEYLSSREGARLRLASMAVPISAVIGALSLRFLRDSGALAGFLLPLCILIATGAFLFGARFVSKRGKRLGLFASLLAVTLIGLIAAVVTTLVVDQSVVVVVAMLAVTLGLGAVYTLATEEIPPVPNTLERATRRWVDLWGSVDPVPAGPTRTNLAGRPETWRVTNLGSIALDHNSYPTNDDECLALIGTELLQHAGIGTPELARPRLNPTERRWRVAWRSINAYLLGGAVAVFALTTWRGADEAAHRWYTTLMEPDGLVNTWYPGNLPGFIPDSISARLADVASGLAYVLLGFIAVQLGHRVWSSWNKVESQWSISKPLENDLDSGDSGSARAMAADDTGDAEDAATEPYRGDGAFKAMIALIVFAWFIALVPQWAWASWQSLDLTSWRGLAVLAGAIGVPIAIGNAVPMVLRSLNIKQWAMSRDIAHVDGLVGYGRYLLREDKTKEAVRILRQAVAMTHQAGHDNADALGSLALALTRLAPRRRRRAEMSRTIASNTGVRTGEADEAAIASHLRAAKRMEIEAKILDLEALELYAQATELRISTPDILAARIAHEHAMRGSRVTVRSLLERAQDRHRDDPAVVRAMVDFEADEIVDRDERVQRLADEIDDWGPTDRLLGLYSLLVEWTIAPPTTESGEPHPDVGGDDDPRLKLRKDIDELLADDHRAPLADVRPLEMRIDTWVASDDDSTDATDVATAARDLRRLVERVAGTVGPLDLTDGSVQRTRAVTTNV